MFDENDLICGSKKYIKKKTSEAIKLQLEIYVFDPTVAGISFKTYHQ